MEHSKLEGRDLPDQHPISAITGLEDALASKANIELQNYYIDPDGDSLPSTPGTVDAPFKSLLTAYNILTQRRMPAHSTTLFVNPGTYPAEPLYIYPSLISPMLTIRATDANSKPTLEFSTAFFRGAPMLTLLDLNINFSTRMNVASTRLTTSGCEFSLSPSFDDDRLLCVYDKSHAVFNGPTAFDYAGKSVRYGMVFHSYGSMHLNSSLTIRNATSFTYAFAHFNQNAMFFANEGSSLTYNPGVVGKRYDLTYHSFVYTRSGGAEYFPGSIDGTALYGSDYYA